MIRRSGVFVALVAMLATASAQTETKKQAPAKKAATGKQQKAAEPPPEQPAAPDTVEEAEHEPTLEEIDASLPPHINGPKLVEIGNNIEIDLPAGMILFEREEARKMLEQSGDHAENVNAVIAKLGSDWLVVVEYDGVGYVSDSDADQLDATELFNQYQEGTRQQNVRRKQLGISELFLDGWSEMPKYHKPDHHLVWGLKAHSESGPVINFFTRILGRHGYMSVDLIDAPDRIEASKQETAALFQATRFKTGARYEDHQEGDASSGMGLRALVLGGTGVAVMKVAKTGFLIKLLLVFKKAFIVVIAGIVGLFKWLLGRKKTEQPTYDAPNAYAVTDDPPPPSSDDSSTPT